MLPSWHQGQRDLSLGWPEGLHPHPEINFEETRTTALVADLLVEQGYQVETGTGKTGVVATLHGKAVSTPTAGGRCVAFRAELDALPMTENAAHSYASATPQRFHGCGHGRVIHNAGSRMVPDDFSELSAPVPGATFFIRQNGEMPHHPEYAFDPEIIPVGAAIFADLAKLRTGQSLNVRHTHQTASIIRGRNLMITVSTKMFKGAVAAVALFATAQMSSAEVLTMSSWVPPTHFIHTDFLVPLTERIAEVTEGRVTVTILPAALASPPQHWELARTGVADITWGNFTYEPERFVSMWFAEFPNAGTNAEAQSRALWQTYEKFLADNAAFEGVKMLAVGMFGGGQLHHGSKAVTAVADVADQKFRMGGPIQEKLLTSLGAVPVAAPATKAYEMLESGVIDGSLHTMESVVNFRLEDVLKHHTVFPHGFYDATFFVVMNGAKWDGLSDADKTAIEGVIGEELSASWGKNFDARNPAAIEKLTAAGHEFSDASPELAAAVDGIHATMVADWVVAAKAAGVTDPEAMLGFYNETYKSLAGE